MKKIKKNEEKKSDINEIKEMNIKKGLPRKQKQNNIILGVIIFMILLIIIIIAVPIIKFNSNKFKYYNLDFQKIEYTNSVIYNTSIPRLNSEGMILNALPWSFRNDPRELESIPIDLINNSIMFLRKKTTYVSVEGNPPPCEENALAVFGMLNFLGEFGGLDIKGAIADKDIANKTNHLYITCENSPDNTVILIKSSNENLIKQTSKNCYEILYKECEVNKVSERFQYDILKDYMSYFNKK